jgi:hypothetical protein
MDTVLACAALARRIDRAELVTLEAYAAIVTNWACDLVAKGQPAVAAYRHALNDSLGLIRASLREREKGQSPAPHRD